MSDLISVARPSKATAPVETEVPAILAGDGWYPDIDLRDARAVLRMADGTITDVRLREAVSEGMAHAMDVLATWRADRERAGITTLQDTKALIVGGENVQVARYRRAVYGWALALLIERYRGYDISKDGVRRADALECAPDDARRDAYWALSDIIGRPRMTVELI
ncbi:MAG: head completion/stabilization protein [Burkholderia gladioli]